MERLYLSRSCLATKPGLNAFAERCLYAIQSALCRCGERALRHLQSSMLPRQHHLLPCCSPVIPPKPAICLNYPVTGDEIRYWVRAYCMTYGSC